MLFCRRPFFLTKMDKQIQLISMTEKEIIDETINFVKVTLQNAEGGHDWWHIERVWKNATAIAATENVNGFVVALAALLHDIADAKFNGGNEEIGPVTATQFLKSIDVEEEVIEQVANIIRNISFKGGNFTQTFTSLELASGARRTSSIGARKVS